MIFYIVSLKTIASDDQSEELIRTLRNGSVDDRDLHKCGLTQLFFVWKLEAGILNFFIGVV